MQFGMYECIYEFKHIDFYLKNPFFYTNSDFLNSNQCVQICIYLFVHTKSYNKTN
jgi:hypothetical protein